MANWTKCGGFALAAMLAIAAPAFAQVSLVGEWSPRYAKKISPIRIPGPEPE